MRLPPQELGRNLAREGGARQPLPPPSPDTASHSVLSATGASLIALLMISTLHPQGLEQITSQHTWAALKGWVAPALPHFLPPSQSTGVPTQGHHHPQGRAAPGPCWSLSQHTVTFSQHWVLGCSQCQSPDERSPTVKHLSTLKVASKRTTGGLLHARALLAGEEMFKHAGEGEAVLDWGLD